MGFLSPPRDSFLPRTRSDSFDFSFLRRLFGGILAVQVLVCLVQLAVYVNGSPTITHFNTIELPGFPSPGTAIAQDPAKFGSAANWIEEINESDFDNYVTFNFDTFQQNLFTLGYTGSSGNSAAPG